MKVIRCSLCRRLTAWVIEGEFFCERHKEEIIKRFDIDRFDIRRLTEDERAFRSGGRAALPILVDNHQEKGQQALKEGNDGQDY
jgi:hypothetical protein